MLTYFANGYRELTGRVTANWRPNWEFFAVIDGRCAPVFGEDDAPELQEKTLWIFAPECRHGWIAEPRRPFFRIVLHFGFVPHPLDTLVRERGGAHSVKLERAQILKLKEIAAELEPHFLKPTQLSPLFFQRRLMDLALLALEQGEGSPQQSLSNNAVIRVENAVAWYAEHLSQTPSIRDVADAMHVSPSHLRRLFWQVQRSSPRAALRKVRLQKVQELMSRSTQTLENIAGSCGFTDASHLCREYKQHHDFTPTFWRRRNVISFEKKPAQAEA